MTGLAGPSAKTDTVPARWTGASQAAQLLAIDPHGLGGIVLKAGPSPARDAWMELMRTLLPPDTPWRRVPAGIDDDRLLGGLDLTATLSAGRAVIQRGLLCEADTGLLVLTMAERLPPGTTTRIAQALDQGQVRLEREGFSLAVPTRFGVIACDESEDDDPPVAPPLAARCAFWVRLDGLPLRSLVRPIHASPDVVAARSHLAHLPATPGPILAALASLAARLGIADLRAPLLAVRAARAAAAWAGHASVDEDDAALAAQLVLAPRAQSLPEPPPNEAAETTPDARPGEDDKSPPADAKAIDRLEEILREAVATHLPADLLAGLAQRATTAARAGARGSGRDSETAMRGRPAGERPGSLRQGARLSILGTLRAAASWQTLRKSDSHVMPSASLAIRPSDFRLKRFVQRREASLIFCVDASGSTAFHRLAEAKGAVEILLARAYVARTHAALVSFRGTSATILLPPTRSLARAKALLAELPGGGGTPLAAGLEVAARLALSEAGRGRDPTVIVLSDGSANIARDGAPGRAQAMADAQETARLFASNRLTSLFIDTSPRPRREGSEIAEAMQARYLALPSADGQRLSAAIETVAPLPV